MIRKLVKILRRVLALVAVMFALFLVLKPLQWSAIVPMTPGGQKDVLTVEGVPVTAVCTSSGLVQRVYVSDPLHPHFLEQEVQTWNGGKRYLRKEEPKAPIFLKCQVPTPPARG